MSRILLNVTRVSVKGPTLSAVNAVTILFWIVVKTGNHMHLHSAYFWQRPSLLARTYLMPDDFSIPL